MTAEPVATRLEPAARVTATGAHVSPAAEDTATPVVTGRVRREVMRTRPDAGMPKWACRLGVWLMFTAFTSSVSRARALTGPDARSRAVEERYRSAPVSGKRFTGHFFENFPRRVETTLSGQSETSVGSPGAAAEPSLPGRHAGEIAR